MHYKSQESYFVLPDEIIEYFYVFGEIDRKVFSRLPQRDINENQVFDRGKKFGKVSVVWGHHLVQFK